MPSLNPERRREIEAHIRMGYPMLAEDLAEVYSALAEAEGKMEKYRALYTTSRFDAAEDWYIIPASAVAAIEEG